MDHRPRSDPYKRPPTRIAGGFLDVWFRPRRFETERFYERLGARVLKRYVPTGGDSVMLWVRRRHPTFRLLDPASLESLRRFERGTRVAEAVHLIGFVGFTVLAARRFSRGALSRGGAIAAVALNLAVGLWPVVLQPYNRVRAYRVINTASTHRRADEPTSRRADEPTSRL